MVLTPSCSLGVPAASVQYAASRRTALDDLVDGGDDPLLERVGERQRHVLAGDPADRARRAARSPRRRRSRRPCRPSRPGTGSPRRSTSREVFATEASTVAMSSGIRQRRSITSARDALVGEPLGGGERHRHGRGQRDERDVGALAHDAAPRPAARRGPAARRSPLLANSPLCSKKTTGSSLRIAEAISPTTSAGVDGADDLQPGHGQRPVLHGLRVLGAEAEAAAVGGAHHQRHGDLAAGHVAHLGDLVGEVVPAAGEEVGEHDLGDRPHPGHRGAHRGADDGLLGDRRVPDPLGAELLEQPDGRLEHARRPRRCPRRGRPPSGRAASPGRCPRRPPRGRCVTSAMPQPPSAHTSVNASAGSASGASFAAATRRRRPSRRARRRPRRSSAGGTPAARRAAARATSSGSRFSQRSTSSAGRYFAGSVRLCP